MTLGENTLYALIFACEVGFWVVLCFGLAFRYIFRSQRLSWPCLLSLPFIDLALLAFTVLDLRNGAVAIIHLLLFAIIKLLNQPDQTRALEDWYRLAQGSAFF